MSFLKGSFGPFVLKQNLNSSTPWISVTGCGSLSGCMHPAASELVEDLCPVDIKQFRPLGQDVCVCCLTNCENLLKTVKQGMVDGC